MGINSSLELATIDRLSMDLPPFFLSLFPISEGSHLSHHHWLPLAQGTVNIFVLHTACIEPSLLISSLLARRSFELTIRSAERIAIAERIVMADRNNVFDQD